MTSYNPESSTTAIPRASTYQSPLPTGMNPATSVSRHRWISQESKPAWFTTEFLSYLACVAGILIAAMAVGDGRGPGNTDYFRADKAFTLITILTVGYMLSRGIAKAGSRHLRDEH